MSSHLLHLAVVNQVPVAPGSSSQGWEECLIVLDLVGGGGGGCGTTGRVRDPRSLWEAAILTKSRIGIMNSIKQQAASKASLNKLQQQQQQRQADSTASLSAHEKLFCHFRVPEIIVKVHSAYCLTFTPLSGPKAWAGPERNVSCDRVFLWHMVKS